MWGRLPGFAACCVTSGKLPNLLGPLFPPPEGRKSRVPLPKVTRDEMSEDADSYSQLWIVLLVKTMPRKATIVIIITFHNNSHLPSRGSRLF